jgi:hypothetical protein
MSELNRDEIKRRKELAKATMKILKTSARSRNWRVSQNSLFRDHDGWFVEIQVNIWAAQPKTATIMRVKPMALDPIFWDIVVAPDNRKQPLSFRAFGSWSCPMPPASEAAISEADGAAEPIADAVLASADRQVETSMPATDFAGYLDFVRTKGDRYFSTRVSTLCLIGRHNEARAECEAAIARGDDGGFILSTEGKMIGFPTMLLNWLDQNEH